MFCPRCGKQVHEDNRYCQECGQEVGAAVAVSPSAVILPPAHVPVSGPMSEALPYAGFWERVIAYLIDGLILGIPFGIVALVVITTMGGFGVILHRHAVDMSGEAQVDPRAAMALAAPMFMLFFLSMLVFIVLQWLYFAGMESSERQATFGKSAMSIRVADYEGKRISFGHATGRFFAKIVSGMVPLAIGYIMAAFTEKKQALHDFIAATVVLKG
jgi:uncharacterized RDD family membrane protein YckC